MTFSVLVVDDHAAWREQLCAELRSSARWRIAGEAADGLEAVRQAHALEPDLILLDIGLPSLNGLEAARQIIANNPASRILFLSEYRSWVVVEAAVGTGARGYLCKTGGAARLLVAMDAIMAGARLVTAGLGGDVVAQTLGQHGERGASRHVAAVYPDTPSLLEDYVRFAEMSLATGSVFILLASALRRDQLHERLVARGVALDRLTGTGHYMFVDAAGASSQLMSGGRLDEARFEEAAAALWRQVPRTATGALPRVALCGEAGPCLFEAGDTDGAICIERLWNELSKNRAVDSLCAYEVDMLRRDDGNRDAFLQICTEHSAVHFRAHSVA